MITRLDAPLKVTGGAKYGADHTFPGMVYGYVLLSTIAHGELEAIDFSAAREAPGVVGVYSPFDPLPLRTPNSMFGETWVPLQDKEVTYYGQPIGFVVAETFEQARDAAYLVQVAYRELPAQTSLAAGLATAEDAPPARDGAPPSSKSSRTASNPSRTPSPRARWSSRRPTRPRPRTTPRWNRTPRSPSGTAAR